MTVGHELRSSVCTRSREWASLRLDGELSMLERHMLERHLDRCPECASFAGQLSALTGLMREAVDEAPPRPISVTAGRRSRRIHATRATLRVASAAAAVACAIGVGILLPVGDGEPIEPGLLVVVQDEEGMVNEGEVLRQERAELPSQADDIARGFREVL